MAKRIALDPAKRKNRVILLGILTLLILLLILHGFGDKEDKVVSAESGEAEVSVLAAAASAEVGPGFYDRLIAEDYDIWALMDNAVVMGDSRAVGYDVFGFMPSERVIAGAGNTIRKIEEGYPQLKELQPDLIYLCYGINDISIGFWKTPEEYAAEYKEILLDLKEVVPDAEIYVSSILPVSAQAVAENNTPVWGRTEEYNVVVEKMCAEAGVGFVSNTDIALAEDNLYSGDGIHISPPFYQKWVANLMIQRLNRNNPPE